MSGIWTKPRYTAYQIFTKKRVPVILSFVSGCFKSKKNNKFAIFCFSGFGLINFDPPKNEFPMMFVMFVNMFARAEDFGSMWVPFEFCFFNKLCSVFSLE